MTSAEDFSLASLIHILLAISKEQNGSTEALRSVDSAAKGSTDRFGDALSGSRLRRRADSNRAERFVPSGHMPQKADGRRGPLAEKQMDRRPLRRLSTMTFLGSGSNGLGGIIGARFAG
jgi:hypothetical protein